ncbi:MAG: HAD family hydrolase [Lachnospiraceae bacterium]|nr:HAD family hydrolase [Lachnospiraceae bacterium]
MKKGIVFFDLDGTLLDNSCDQVPDSALLGLSELRKNGYVIVLSTGRDMDTHYSVKYKDIVKPDAIIHRNGNRITIGEEELFIHYMDKGLLRRIIDFCLINGLCVGTSIGESDYFTIPEEKTRSDVSYRGFSERNYRSVEELFNDDILVSAIDFAGNIKKAKTLVEAKFPELTLFPFNSGTGADVVETGFSKADGMVRLCEYYRIPIENTYAFGDSQNDIPMLKKAAVGVAVGNAADSVKEAADMVTDHISDGGIYNALKLLKLI